MEAQEQMKSKNKLFCYDFVNNVYIANTLGTEITENIADAKDFTWLWIFKNFYLFALRKVFPEKMLAWIHAIHLENWNIEVAPSIKQ